MPGLPLDVTGVVRDADGKPVADAAVDVWQASPVGLYENQDETQEDMNLRGLFRTDAEGRFHLRSVRPAGYPVPTDGPCGELLRAQRRHPNRPAHLHFMISKPGYKVLVSQVFADDDENLESDPVFGVTRKLIGKFAVSPDGQSLGAWSEDGTVQVAGARPPCTMRIERHGIGAVTRFGWTPDGKHLVLFSGTTVRLLRVADGALLVSPRPAT